MRMEADDDDFDQTENQSSTSTSTGKKRNHEESEVVPQPYQPQPTDQYEQYSILKSILKSNFPPFSTELASWIYSNLTELPVELQAEAAAVATAGGVAGEEVELDIGALQYDVLLRMKAFITQCQDNAKKQRS